MLDIKKSAEVVDKLICHVCYKKTEGKLYLMGERLGWMTNTSEQFKISESYKNIRMQRVSQDEKEKVQLQLLIYSGPSYTFQFVHSDGKERQMRDRNEVKNYLQHILPKFKDKATAELEQKKQLCEKNPQILELYKELVAGKYICKEEFWSKTESSYDLRKTLNIDDYPRGVPSCLMSVAPESIGAQYNLSEQMIEDIFQVYPSIKRKHNQLVKCEQDKVDFWQRFFQSHYFYRDRVHLSQDKFVSCADQDALELRTVAQKLRQLYSLTSEDQPLDIVNEAQSLSTDDEKILAKISTLQLVKRFNLHTFMLLQSMDRSLKRQNVDLDSDVVDKKRPLYEDDELKTISADKNQAIGVAFNTAKVMEYINKISDSTTVTQGIDFKRCNVITDDTRQRFQNMKKVLLNTSSNRALNNIITSSVATDVLTTVGHLFSNADIALANYTKSGRSLSTASNEMEREIKTLYRVVEELLRHFWSCFPITDTTSFEKLHRLKDSIKKFKEQKLDTFCALHTNYYLLTGSMENKPTEHLSLMIDAALEAFNRFIENYNQINKTKE